MSKEQKLAFAFGLLAPSIILVGIGIHSVFFKSESNPSISAQAEAKTSPVVPKVKLIRTEQSITVRATESWKDTQINVEPGDTVTVTASGSVVWDPALPPTDPDGVQLASTVPSPDEFPVPDARCGSLVMKIGSSTYKVGTKATAQAYESASIRFMVNDRFYALSDNSGAFVVRIRVER
jgi:hypothetical protein